MRVVTLQDRTITAHGSTGMTLHPVPAPPPADERHVVVVELEPGGRIGRHPAMGWQLFVVTAGAGEVRGADGGRHLLQAGQAAVWEPGELHETSTKDGLVAVILESDGPPDLSAVTVETGS